MKKFFRLITMGVVAAGLTVGASTTSASAAPRFMTATLSISNPGVVCCNDHRVTVTGLAVMPKADAQRFIAQPGQEASFALWGEDDGFFTGGDDRLTAQTNFTTYWAADDGLHFRKTITVDRSVLNEDSGGDEVYAKVTLLDIRTGLRPSVKSNVVKNWW
jgi:hypothetical protein